MLNKPVYFSRWRPKSQHLHLKNLPCRDFCRADFSVIGYLGAGNRTGVCFCIKIGLENRAGYRRYGVTGVTVFNNDNNRDLGILYRCKGCKYGVVGAIRNLCGTGLAGHLKCHVAEGGGCGTVFGNVEHSLHDGIAGGGAHFDLRIAFRTVFIDYLSVVVGRDFIQDRGTVHGSAVCDGGNIGTKLQRSDHGVRLPDGGLQDVAGIPDLAGKFLLCLGAGDPAVDLAGKLDSGFAAKTEFTGIALNGFNAKQSADFKEVTVAGV